MNYETLKVCQKIFFIGEKLPMELIAKNDNYGVVIRSLDIDEDFDLLAFEIERGAAIDGEDALETNKHCPVYSLLDFKEEKRAPSNLIFNIYDFWCKSSCEQSIEDLESGQHELSKRHGIDLKIDWDRTNETCYNN